MQTWDTRSIDVEPHQPQVLHSDDEGRTIVINLPAGEELQDHQVHERAWILVVDGEVEIEAGGETVKGGPGFLALTEPNERHEVRAMSDARLCWCWRPGPARDIPPQTRTASAEPEPLRALLYDIHGNLPALEAVVADARAAGADQFVLGGDYALAGAFPQETVKALRQARRGLDPRATPSAGSRSPPTRPATSCCTARSSTAATSSGSKRTEKLFRLPEQHRSSTARCVCHASPHSDMLTFMPEPTGGDESCSAHTDAERRDLRPQPPPVLARGRGRARCWSTPAASACPSTATGAPPTRSGTAAASSSCAASSTTPTATRAQVRERMGVTLGDTVETLVRRIEQAAMVA